MGLEPTTFCMASRRSSQLSYIREAASIASLRTVENVVDGELDRLLEAGDKRAVLRDVVRRDADALTVCGEHRAVLGLEHVAIGRRPRVAARAAVRRQPRLHSS